MVAIYITIILICRVIQAIFNKQAGNETKTTASLLGFTTYQTAIAAILGLLVVVLGGNGFDIDIKTVLIASFSGITLFFSVFFGIGAMKSGTVSLSSMFGTAGLIIPLIAGVFIFNQPVRPLQWAGVVIFFISAWLLIGSSKAIFGNFSFKTFLLLIGTLVSNGGTMLAQQAFTAFVPDGDVSVFSFLSFGITAVLGYLIYLFVRTKKQENAETSKKSRKVLVISGIALAVAVFLINQAVTLSTTLLSPVMLFTFANGGGTIITAITAAVIYNEPLTKRSILGIALGVLSLVVIKCF